MRFLTAFLLLLFPISSLSIHAESYRWPLERNLGITATFGEFRDDHFHAGIDLSTNGKTGLRVLAIADGEVYRLKIQKRAYGRALYIRHANGIISVYAHLQSYSKAIGLEQKYQQKAAELNQRYVGDVMIEPPVPVRKGEVVAFSGESGAGLPHLHLELRKTEAVSINPLKNGFHDSADYTPPIFQACYFYPMDARAAINNELQTRVLQLKKKGSSYIADEKPVVRGNFYVAVSVYDPTRKRYSRAPEQISFSIDEQRLYSLEFAEISYTNPEGFGLVYDLGKPGPAWYEYPYIMKRLTTTPVSFAANSIQVDTEQLMPGPHQIRIEARDANGNKSIAAVDFIVNHPPAVQIKSASMEGSTLKAGLAVSDSDSQSSLTPELDYSVDRGKTFAPLSPEAGSGQTDFTYQATLQSSATAVILKARVSDGIEHSAYTFAQLPVRSVGSQPTGKIRWASFTNTVEAIVDLANFFPGPMKLQAGPSSYDLQAQSLTSYRAVIPVPPTSAPLTLKVTGLQPVSIPVFYAKQGTVSKIDGGKYQILLESNTLFWNTFVWADTISAENTNGLTAVGPALKLSPRGLPLQQYAGLRFYYPDDQRHPEKLSIYSWDRAKEKWISLPSSVNQTARTVETKIKTFDVFALLSDEVPPTITPVFPGRRGVTRERTPTLIAGIRDTGMQINDEKVTFYLDGLPSSAEYDPDRNQAFLKVKAPLLSGSHHFRVVAFDNAGNKSETGEIGFRVR